MMKKFYGKVRRAVGFTTAEVLIVVAIIAVLLTLAMPNVLAYFRGLRLTELDDDARTIFLAAQNRLTALVNSGEADKLAAEGHEVTPASPADPSAPAIPAEVKGLYKLSSDADADLMSLLIPAGSIESSLTSGHYIVYYFPNSGAVYSVWYCDKDGFSTEFTDKDKRLQQSVLVGYYGDSVGNVIDRAKVGQLPIPKVTLTNAEELRLDIEMPFESGSEVKPENVTLEVTITGASSGAVKTLLKANFGAGDPAHKVTIVLDTLKVGYTMPTDGAASLIVTNYGGRFSDIAKDTGIHPGEDITVTVKASYTPDDGGKDFTDQTVSVKGNSLFAFVSDGHTANIAYGRHLQNLNNDETGITAANQIRDIDFSDKTSVTEIESWAKTYGETTPFAPINNSAITSYNGNKLKIRRMTVGVSDGNSGLFADVKNGTFTDIVLVDCRTTEAASVGTLAGTAEKAVFSGCEVYVEDRNDDTTVSTAPLLTGQTVGGLVGAVNGGCEFKYSFASTVESGKTVGGLVGEVTAENTTFTSCYAAGYLKYLGSEKGGGAKDSGYIAGLVGNAEVTTTIRNCYTAGVITGDLLHDNSGGSSGKSATVAGTANGTGASVPDGSTVYAAVIYSNTGTHSGDIPVTATVADAGENCFYVNQSGVTFNESGAVQKTASGMMTDTESFSTGKGWLSDSASNPGYTVFPYNQTDESKSLASPYPYPELIDARKGKGGAPIFHHGDWQYSRFYTAGYFYWELEAGEYHFYLVEWESEDGENWHAIGKDGTNEVTLIDTLCYDYHEINNVPNVEESGYGYFTSGFDTAPSVSVSGTEYTQNEKLSAALEKEVGTSVTAKSYTAVNMGSSTYAAWSFNGEHNIPTAYLCSDFAASIAVNDNTATYTKEGTAYATEKRGIPNNANDFGTADYPYVVRSIAQLDNVDARSAAYMGSDSKHPTFEQQHDLNGKGQSAFQMIGPDMKAFYGHFIGLGYRILDLNIVGNLSHAALFANLGAGSVIEQVIMYSPSGTATVTATYDSTYRNGDQAASVNAAGIAADGWAASSNDDPVIKNCIVAGYTIQVTGNGYGLSKVSSTAGHYIGGIAAWCRAKIDSCEAVVTLRSDAGNISGVSDNYKNVFAGGIIGGTNRATITNCYAGGIIYTATSVTPSNDPNIRQFSGGILGNIDNAQAAGNATAIERCYSYMNMLRLETGMGTRRGYLEDKANDVQKEYYIQAIGPAYNGDGTYGNNSYWSAGVPARDDAYHKNSATGVAFDGLTDFKSWTGYSFHNATYVNGVASNAFKLGAIVNVPVAYNGNGNRTTAYVHYGWYPKDDTDRYPPTP